MEFWWTYLWIGRVPKACNQSWTPRWHCWDWDAAQQASTVYNLADSWSLWWQFSHASNPYNWASHASAHGLGTCESCTGAMACCPSLEYWPLPHLEASSRFCNSRDMSCHVIFHLNQCCYVEHISRIKGDILDAVLVLAATCTLWARSDCIVVEGREGNTAGWVLRR